MSNNTIRRKTASMLALLAHGHHSLYDIAERCGMHYESVRPFVKELHAAGVVHIAAWRRTAKAGKPSALYALGIGVDTPCPVAKTGLQRQVAYAGRRADKPLRRTPTVVRSPASVFDLHKFV